MSDAALECRHCGVVVESEFEAYGHVCVGLSWHKRFAIWGGSKAWMLRHRLREMRCRLLGHQFTEYPYIRVSSGVKPGRSCARCRVTFYDPPIALA